MQQQTIKWWWNGTAYRISTIPEKNPEVIIAYLAIAGEKGGLTVHRSDAE